MQVSSINENTSTVKSLFIRYANTFMSNPREIDSDIIEKSFKNNSDAEKNKPLGIETLTTFSIYPKQVINGKTVITA